MKLLVALVLVLSIAHGEFSPYTCKNTLSTKEVVPQNCDKPGFLKHWILPM